MKPHKHAALIKAWADGAIIQYLLAYPNHWKDCENNLPKWLDCLEYRIKPEPSDLEKYGVEVGDMWLLAEGNKFFNFFVVRITGNPVKVEGIEVGEGVKKYLCLDEFDAMLCLRRGVVNKL